jgi:hypothetical protein
MEYFTVAHPPVFATENPTLLGIGWGIIATWWVGAILGVLLALAARVGSRPKRTAASLIRPMLVLFACVGVLAIASGLAGYFAASRGLVAVLPPYKFSIPPEKHVAFLVDLHAHNASYLGGFLGGLFLIAWVWWTRIRTAILAKRRTF